MPDNKDCLNCIHFESFFDAYDQDEFEPHEQGFCLNSKSPFHMSTGKGTPGEGELCKEHKLIENIPQKDEKSYL